MNTMTAETRTQHALQETEWIKVCEENDLLADTGICALVNNQQVAVFKSRRLNELFAISNYDPIGEANVLSRGIIGSIGEAVVVASPLYKQHFNLRTGDCLEQPEHKLAIYSVRIQDGWIEVREPIRN